MSSVYDDFSFDHTPKKGENSSENSKKIQQENTKDNQGQKTALSTMILSIDEDSSLSPEETKVFSVKKPQGSYEGTKIPGKNPFRSYTIGSEINRGQFARVHLCSISDQDDRFLALKILLNEDPDQKQEYIRHIKSFQRELLYLDKVNQVMEEKRSQFVLNIAKGMIKPKTNDSRPITITSIINNEIEKLEQQKSSLKENSQKNKDKGTISSLGMLLLEDIDHEGISSRDTRINDPASYLQHQIKLLKRIKSNGSATSFNEFEAFRSAVFHYDQEVTIRRTDQPTTLSSWAEKNVLKENPGLEHVLRSHGSSLSLQKVEDKSWICYEFLHPEPFVYINSSKEIQSANPDKTDPVTAYKMFKEILSVIKFQRDIGFVHQDIKPENIMILPISNTINPRPEKYLTSLIKGDYKFILADPGCAEKPEDRARQDKSSSSPLGSPAYMHKDQFYMNEQDLDPQKAQDLNKIDQAHKLDIYSLALSAYQVLTGKAPQECSYASELREILISKDNNVPKEKLDSMIQDFFQIREDLLKEDHMPIDLDQLDDTHLYSNILIYEKEDKKIMYDKPPRNLTNEEKEQVKEAFKEIFKRCTPPDFRDIPDVTTLDREINNCRYEILKRLTINPLDIPQYSQESSFRSDSIDKELSSINNAYMHDQCPYRLRPSETIAIRKQTQNLRRR